MTSFLAAATVLAGCGDAPTPGPGPTTRQVTAEDEAQRLLDLEALAESSGIENPPDVPVVRWVHRTDVVQVLADCLTDEGFDVVADTDGLVISSHVDQEEALAMASYVCEAKFPRIPPPPGPPPVEYVHGLYDYYTGELAACLSDRGHPLTDVPSREVFTDTFLDPDAQWSPYGALLESGALLSDSAETMQACPQFPTDGRFDSFG